LTWQPDRQLYAGYAARLFTDEEEESMSRRNESDKEGLSKRQTRREEIRRKERRQRWIVIGILVLVSAVILGIIVVPMVQNTLNPGGDFLRVTPGAYTNANGKTMGDPNAPVKIEVFEDFSCSACRSYTLNVEPNLLTQIVDKGGVYYVFHQFPFLDDQSADKRSDRAANAAECAVEQGKFWDFKELLYLNQGQEATNGEFSPERLAAFANSLGMDTARFSACLKENRYQSAIDQDLKLGSELKITGTPSLFVNGKEVSPGRVPTLQEILAAVQQANAAPAVTATP
jgi:protein-disulfide isomerase